MALAASQKVEELMTPPAPVASGEGPTAAAAGEAGSSEVTAAAGADTPPASPTPAMTQAVAEQRAPSPAAVKTLKGIQGEGR